MTNNKVMVKANKREKISNSLFYEEIGISLPSGCKVVGVTALSKLYNSEALSGELKIAGKFVIRAIYMTGENEISVMEKASDYSEAITIPTLLPSNKVFLSSNIIETVYSGEAIDMKIRLTLEISGYYIKECSLAFLDCQEEDIICKKTMIKVESIAILSDTNIESSETFEAKMPLSKILTYNTVCWINNIYPSKEIYQVEGETLTTVVALGDSGQLVYQIFPSSFTTEVPDPNITASSEIVLDCFIKSTTITLEEAGSRNLIIDLEVGLKGVAVVANEIEGITDAYCTKKELNISLASTMLDTNICYKRIRENISGSAVIENGSVRNIECILSPMIGTISIINNFGLTVEGIFTAAIVYKNQDDVMETLIAEFPYQINVSREYECNAQLAASVVITSCNAKIKNSTEIEISAELIITVKGVDMKEISLVSDIEYGNDKEINDIAISLYLAREGENLWDIAKALSTDEKTLMKLNPDIKLPIESGEKILLYRELME